MTVSKIQMMHYFFDLEEKGYGSKERFTAMWQGIARQATIPKDLSIILHRVDYRQASARAYNITG